MSSHSFIQLNLDNLIDVFNEILRLRSSKFIVDDAYIEFSQKNIQNFLEFCFIVELHDFHEFDYYDEKN